MRKYNRYTIMFNLLYVIITMLFIFFICFGVFLTNGFIEKKPVRSILDTFKQRGEYVETVGIHSQKVNIYKVHTKYKYEKDNFKEVFNYKDGKEHYIGSKTDIILSNRNPLRNHGTALVADAGLFFSSNFFIGHATININDDGSKYIESVGNDAGFYGVRESDNTWIETEVRYGNDAQTIVGLRLKNVSEEKKDDIVGELKEKIGCEYNANILIKRKNKYYCTDLISRCLNKYNINIDYDRMYPTGNDFIVSENTFVIFICERIVEGEFNIYYLSEE